jgi:hypothetical protein
MIPPPFSFKAFKPNSSLGSKLFHNLETKPKRDPKEQSFLCNISKHIPSSSSYLLTTKFFMPKSKDPTSYTLFFVVQTNESLSKETSPQLVTKTHQNIIHNTQKLKIPKQHSTPYNSIVSSFLSQT